MAPDENGHKTRKPINDSGFSHVGGISDELGGVDPEIDQNLMRLSGGP